MFIDIVPTSDPPHLVPMPRYVLASEGCHVAYHSAEDFYTKIADAEQRLVDTAAAGTLAGL